MSKRRIVLISAALALLGVVLAAIPVREELGWVDALSGTHKRQTVWLFALRTPPVVVPSPLAQRFQLLGIQWLPDWRNVQGTHCNLLGRPLSRAHGMAPPIYDFPLELQRSFCQLASDDEVRAFHQVMTSGNDEERRSAVQQANSRVFAAILEGAFTEVED